jgi:hypothetical protein
MWKDSLLFYIISFVLIILMIYMYLNYTTSKYATS